MFFLEAPYPRPIPPIKICTALPPHWGAGNRYVWARLICRDRRWALGSRRAKTCRSLKTSNHFQQLSAVRIRCRRDSCRHEREGVCRRECHSLSSNVSNVSPLTIRCDAFVTLSLFSIFCAVVFFTHLSPPTFCVCHASLLSFHPDAPTTTPKPTTATTTITTITSTTSHSEASQGTVSPVCVYVCAHEWKRERSKKKNHCLSLHARVLKFPYFVCPPNHDWPQNPKSVGQTDRQTAKKI